jgi:hypothetical protein
MDAAYEVVPAHRRVWKRTMALIAGSYLLDVAILALLAAAGVIPGAVVGGYGLVGFSTTLAFYLAIASGWSERFADSSLAFPQLVVAVAVQLAFIVVAPPAAMYFVSVLFVVFGFGALRMRPRHVVVSLAVVSLALVALFTAVPGALSLPTQTAASRALVVFAIVTTLVRCSLLGLYSSQLRALLAHRYAAARQEIAARRHRAGADRDLADPLGLRAPAPGGAAPRWAGGRHGRGSPARGDPQDAPAGACCAHRAGTGHAPGRGRPSVRRRRRPRAARPPRPRAALARVHARRRPRCASNSAICTALRAAPLRRLSFETNSTRPCGTVGSRRMRPT